MTIKELKEILASWSEEDVYGEDTEVYVGVENGGSRAVQYICSLNRRIDDRGIVRADMSIEIDEEAEEGLTIDDMKLR